MKHTVLLLLSILFSAGLAFAQTPAPAPDPQPVDPSVAQKFIKPGQKITDSKGREVSVPAGATGKVRVQTDKPITGPDRMGCFMTTGEIQRVTNRASGGASEFSVDTNGEPTEVKVEDSGSSNSNNDVTVDGGNATVNVTGDNNMVTVGGTGNTVTLGGNNNSGMGANPPPMGPPPGGDVTLGGSGNSWSSNGGNWNVGTS